MSASSYVLLVRPDAQHPDQYVALCPDIPGWFATGDSPSEASSRGAEIVRGILSERQANGTKLPAVRTQSVQVSATAPPPAPEQNPMAALCESEGFQTLASVVAESRGLCRSEGGDGQPALVSSEVRPGRVLKSKRVKPSR
jgi:predicted RNase H-like HicB family nuclease